VKVDLKNAYNEVSCSAIIENLQAEPSLQHLAWFAAVTLSPETGLESRGELWGRKSEGDIQGDPKAGAFFCVGIQPQVRDLCATVREAGGIGVFGMDDGYVVGPGDVVRGGQSSKCAAAAAGKVFESLCKLGRYSQNSLEWK
jgi:hypothetical protein